MPGIEILIGGGLSGVAFVWLWVSLLRWSNRNQRRRAIKRELIQQYQDANDTQQIAQQLLRKYDR